MCAPGALAGTKRLRRPTRRVQMTAGPSIAHVIVPMPDECLRTNTVALADHAQRRAGGDSRLDPGAIWMAANRARPARHVSETLSGTSARSRRPMPTRQPGRRIGIIPELGCQFIPKIA